MVVDANELTRRVRQGDEAEKILFESLIPVVNRIARRTVSKYPWFDLDDLSQKMMLVIPSVIRKYDPDNKADFGKYAYHRLYFEAKDCLREHDPLGVSWPQKTKEIYPAFSRLGDSGLEGYEPKDHREEEVIEFDELTEEEQLFESMIELKEYFKTIPKPPKPKKVRKKKYFVPASANFKTFVRHLLGGRKQQMKFNFGE